VYSCADRVDPDPRNSGQRYVPETTILIPTEFCSDTHQAFIMSCALAVKSTRYDIALLICVKFAAKYLPFAALQAENSSD